MKTHLKNALCLMLGILALSCSKEEVEPEPAELTPVEIQFGPDTFYSENLQGNEVKILFDKPALSPGTLTIKVISDALSDFSTVPEINNQHIVISVEKGAPWVKFQINPQDNWFIDGHKSAIFQLESVSPGFKMGAKKDILIDLFDDELKWKPRSYEIIKGGNSIKKTYTYMEDGKLATLEMETKDTQGTSTKVFTYKYDIHGKLHRIENSFGGMELFVWDNGRIIRSEVMEAGVITIKKEYEYDNAGNVIQVGVYEFMPENNYYAYNMVEVYQYQDGDLKSKVVHHTDGPLNWKITSTCTYEAYLEKENPFNLINILPTVNFQPRLLQSFRMEKDGNDIQVRYSYEYDASGFPIKRVTTGEVANFEYY